MQSKPYLTKAGSQRFRPIVSADELAEANLGFCLACGAEAYGIEPDARNYLCEACHQGKVFGLEELLLMGLAECPEEVGE